MNKRPPEKDKGLPVIVLDLGNLPEAPDVPKEAYKRQGKINLSAVRAQLYHNRNLPRPNRYFPSIFGPGGGYTDSSWI